MYGKKSECSIDDILNVLGERNIEQDVVKIRKTLKQVMILQSRGTADTELLFPVVVKYIASNDIVAKKIACNFIRNHGHRQDLILLAINSLLKDCTDPSPMTRGLALRTLTDLPHQADYSTPQILAALDDSSAYVRRIAVMACAKIFKQSHELADSHGFVDLLYARIRDSDPIVVVNCLNGLDELLAAEGGAAINKNIAYYLLNNIRLFSDWCLVSILKFLRRYTPESEDEIYAIMNISDQNLTSNNATVVIATMEYFFFLVRDMPHLIPEILERASGQLLHILSLGHPEINYALLEVLVAQTDERAYVQSVQDYFQSFFCKQTDPLYIKAQKMTILPRLVNDDNVKEITAELALHCRDSDPAVVRLSIKALGKIVRDKKDALDSIVPNLIVLVSRQNNDSSGEVLQMLQHLDLSESAQKQTILEHVGKAASVVADVPGKCALLVLLGKYGKDMREAVYTVETFIDGADGETDEALLCELMSCAVKLFVSRPAECQDMLGKLLELCHGRKNVHVQDQAKFYYSLLKSGLVADVL